MNDFNPTKELVCRECQKTVTVEASWRMAVCRQCHAGITTPMLRKCSRCKMHVKNWETSSYYCRPCNAAMARESRARRKSAGESAWSIKTCSQCGLTESMPPESSWCRKCRNAYQRQWKREHPNAHEIPPQPPQPVTGREELRNCSHCRKSRPYNRKEFFRGSVCRKCYQSYQRKADANEKEKFRLWRENATPVECRTCHQVKPYERGWDGRLCRECQAIRAKQTYEAVKASPERLRNRNAKQDAARRRRQQAASIGDAGQDTKPAETPEIALQDAQTDRTEINEEKRKEIVERVRERLAKKGIAPLTGRVVVDRS